MTTALLITRGKYRGGGTGGDQDPRWAIVALVAIGVVAAALVALGVFLIFSPYPKDHPAHKQCIEQEWQRYGKGESGWQCIKWGNRDEAPYE